MSRDSPRPTYPFLLEKANLPGEVPRKLVRRYDFERADTRLPTSGGTMCWHCCHHPGETPIPMPLSYDSLTDSFRVTGTFCSFPCIKAYNFGRNTYKKEVNSLNISLFAARYFGRVVRIQTAPERDSLMEFGGTMTIEEFRKRCGVLPGRRGVGGRGITAEIVDPRSHLVRATEEFARTVARVEPITCPKRKASEAAASARKKKKRDDAAAAHAGSSISAPVENAVLKLKRVKPGGGGEKPDLLSTLMGLQIISH